MSSADALREFGARIGLIAGSGLDGLLAAGSQALRVPYRDVSGIPLPTAPGHAGVFVAGECGGARILAAHGRAHLYEGHSASDTTALVRFLATCGVRVLLVTNAAGAVSAARAPGDWMVIRDHLNLTGCSPLVGEARFLDMRDAYSGRLRRLLLEAAQLEGFDWTEGVYASVLGPQYETPAEVAMLRGMGADAVGMSTVLEVIQARALGIEVAGFSCITNLPPDMPGEPLAHADVLSAARSAASAFARVLARAAPRLGT